MEIVQEYKSVRFPPDILSMFADIVEKDEWMLSVFVYIVNRMQKESSNFNGVTVNDIANNVKIERLVKVSKQKHANFETQTTYIHRKTAGRLVDKLLAMSLLSCKPITPYKYYFITKRGLQVIEEIIQRQKNKEMINNG
jgi:hypothetical protein